MISFQAALQISELADAYLTELESRVAATAALIGRCNGVFGALRYARLL